MKNKLLKISLSILIIFSFIFLNFQLTQYIWGLKFFSYNVLIFYVVLILGEIEGFYSLIRRNYTKTIVNLLILLLSYFMGLVLLNIDFIMKLFLNINVLLMTKSINQIKLNIWLLGFVFFASFLLLFDSIISKIIKTEKIIIL